MAENFLAERDVHLLDDEYWASKRPILENIEVPALICASWSDHGLHTRGSIEAFERISSKQKWLFWVQFDFTSLGIEMARRNAVILMIKEAWDFNHIEGSLPVYH
jgi:hypothetical protein